MDQLVVRGNYSRLGRIRCLQAASKPLPLTSPVTGFMKVSQITQWVEPVSIVFGGTANVDDPVSAMMRSTGVQSTESGKK